MWIGSIRLTVETNIVPDAGTDHLVQAIILRDDTELIVLNLDYPTENDLEASALRDYDYPSLPRRNDKTPELPTDIRREPMPYPEYGLEFSNGLQTHLKIRLRIRGDDMWIKDKVDLYLKVIRNPSRNNYDWE